MASSLSVITPITSGLISHLNKFGKAVQKWVGAVGKKRFALYRLIGTVFMAHLVLVFVLYLLHIILQKYVLKLFQWTYF